MIFILEDWHAFIVKAGKSLFLFQDSTSLEANGLFSHVEATLASTGGFS